MLSSRRKRVYNMAKFERSAVAVFHGLRKLVPSTDEQSHRYVKEWYRRSRLWLVSCADVNNLQWRPRMPWWGQDEWLVLMKVVQVWPGKVKQPNNHTSADAGASWDPLTNNNKRCMRPKWHAKRDGCTKFYLYFEVWVTAVTWRSETCLTCQWDDA